MVKLFVSVHVVVVQVEMREEDMRKSREALPLSNIPSRGEGFIPKLCIYFEYTLLYRRGLGAHVKKIIEF